MIDLALTIALLIGMTLHAAIGLAQDYPSRPLRIITSPAGGGSDLQSRVIGQSLAARVGQQVIVDNRASDTLGLLITKAEPDGYTLLLMGSVIWIEPLMKSRPTYDPLKDLLPISMISTQPNVLVITPSIPAKSVADLIALAKAKPGLLNYATGGAGSGAHLSAELFKSMAHIDIVRINYKGTALALNDLIGGQVQLMFASAATVVQHLKSGRLRALAVTSAQRSALYPDLPTVDASGLPGFKVESIYGMWVPAKTPAVIIRTLNKHIVAILSTNDLKEKFFAAGLEPAPSSPEHFTALIKSEMSQWGALIKEAGIRID